MLWFVVLRAKRFHFDGFACGSLSVFLKLKYPMSSTSSGYIQENQPKSLQHNTLNKSHHRKETAQSLFMAEPRCLSSKQQILLNLYQVSDEQQQRERRRSELKSCCFLFFFLVWRNFSPVFGLLKRIEKCFSISLAKKICQPCFIVWWFVLQII